MEKLPYLGESIVRWQVGKSTFLAHPERGARLMNWNLTLGDGSVRDILHWPEIDSLDGFARVRGGNPVLFPFAGRTFDRGDIHFWRDSEGTRRPMPIHGLARQGTFRVSRQDGTGFAATLVPGDEAAKCYPFDFEFTVTYRFEPLGFSCEFSLRNQGKAPLPWCAGHHFYFNVPWDAGTSRSDCLARIPASHRLRQDATGALVPGPELSVDTPLSDPALIDTLHTGLRKNEVILGEKNRPGDIVIRFGDAKTPDPDATIVTWTESATSPFYCVEPWMGPPNAPENRRGLQLVPPGQTRSFIVKLVVR